MKLIQQDRCITIHLIRLNLCEYALTLLVIDEISKILRELEVEQCNLYPWQQMLKIGQELKVIK